MLHPALSSGGKVLGRCWGAGEVLGVLGGAEEVLGVLGRCWGDRCWGGTGEVLGHWRQLGQLSYQCVYGCHSVNWGPIVHLLRSINIRLSIF